MFGAMVLQGQTSIDLRTQSKSVDFSWARATKPVQTGTSLPATCGVGELFFLLSATPGQNSFGCTAANTWSAQGAVGSGLPSGIGHANQVLSSDGTTAQWLGLAGDVSGSPLNLQVSGLQGRTVATVQPVDGQVLRWNNSAHDWEPGSLSAVMNYSKSFTGAVAVNINGTEHNLATANLIVSCYDNSIPAILLKPLATTIDPSAFNVAVTFASAQSGYCVVNGLGGSGLTPAAGGDLSGLLSIATVKRLQNRPVSSSTPTDGQVLTWNQAAGQWQPQTAASGGGSGASQLSTLSVAYASSTTLNLAVGCAQATPCNVRFGNTVYAISASATAVLQSGVGSAYIYISSTGALTVGSNLSIACSGCVATANIANFPPNTIPLYVWNAVPSGWDPTGGTDYRAYLSTKVLAPGIGLTVTDSGTQSTIAVDASTVPGYLAGTAILSFGTVAAASCSSELTISVIGGNPGDSVAPGWPALLPGNVMGMMRVSSGDTVGVRLCNPTGTPTTVPSASFGATIVRTL